MKTSKYVIYGVAALAAVLLALLVRGMMTGKPSTPAKASVEAPAAAPGARVLVVTHDIKAGSRLADSDLAWQEWPVAALNPAYIVDGGLDAWKAAGLPVEEDRGQPLELMRQVQIAAGSLVLTSVALGFLVGPAFFGLSGFVGAGLLLAGATGWCGMARLLAGMPWNRRALAQ